MDFNALDQGFFQKHELELSAIHKYNGNINAGYSETRVL